MAELLPCVEIEPTERHTGSVIWMHGLGASGHDFVPIVPALRRPDLRFVFPHAPARAVTINGGFVMPSWYDIRTLDRSPDREDETEIRESATMVEALLRAELDAGVPAERIVLAGFSQGAAMALHVGLRFAETLAGIMVLSGYRLLADTILAERSDANRGTPILMCHGVHDDMLPIALGRETFEFIKEHADTDAIEWHEYPMGHEVCPDEVDVIAAWLAARLPSSAGAQS